MDTKGGGRKREEGRINREMCPPARRVWTVTAEEERK